MESLDFEELKQATLHLKKATDIIKSLRQLFYNQNTEIGADFEDSERKLLALQEHSMCRSNVIDFKKID